MNEMLVMNATDVRKDWSAVIDSVVREKPKFIKRTRDYMILANIKTLESILDTYTFTADEYVEENGSITLSLAELPLVENGRDKEEAVSNLANGILEYAEIFYEYFDRFAANESDIPYVFKALLLNDAEKIGGLIICHPGKN